MRFVTAIYDNYQFVGVVNDDLESLIPLNLLSEHKYGKNIFPSQLVDCIKLGDSFINDVTILINWARETGIDSRLSKQLTDVKLLAPIPVPEKNIFCIGKNYAAHALELGEGSEVPENLMVFTKAPTTVIGHEDNVIYNELVTNELDYEGELAVVIGKTGRNIKREDAFDYVFGYTIINDITARDLQEKHKQFFLGKSLDSSCPTGPWIVHHSQISNPHSLHIETRVNGEVRQSASTEQFIFPIDNIIEQLSQVMTLEKGDIIATGTPAGVGKGFNPPKYLKSGDTVEITIEEIGTLRNKII